MLNPPQDEDPGRSPRTRTVAAGALVVVVVVAVAVVGLLLSRRGNGDTSRAANSTVAAAAPAPNSATTSRSTTAPTTTSSPTATAQCSYPASGTAAKPVSAPAVANPPDTGVVQGELVTSAGTIPVVLNRAEAPCTVASLVALARQGYYDTAPCHRLTTSAIFILQCGDPTGTGTGGPGYTVPDELPTTPAAGGGYYPRGTVAMANTGSPNTSGSQFFLAYKDSPLPRSYTVVGTVSAPGLATLDTITISGTSTGATDGAPATPVSIVKFSVGA